MAVDEMDDAVMGAAEAVAEERRVGIGDEVAIGEEEQLDERNLGLLAGREGRGHGGVRSAFRPFHARFAALEIYVSHVDIFSIVCY